MRVLDGQLVILRLFDLAYQIDLPRAEAIWAERAPGASARGRLVGTPAKAVSFGVPPLALQLGSVALEVAGRNLSASAAVRLYDFGVAAIALRLPIADLEWPAVAALANNVQAAIGPGADASPWDRLLSQVRDTLGSTLERPNALPLQEDYLIAQVHAFERPLAAEELLEQLDLVPLLSGQDRPLSEGAKRDLLRHRFSYHPDDLAVITWDRAFLLEPRRETDVADVLEIANAQLLEMRSYDVSLDEELPRLQAMISTARSGTNLLAARRYARLARRLHALVAEVSELAERVDNALQVTEDVYLARVYGTAMELFRVPAVNAAVDRKLAIIRETYTALHDEAAGSRAELLEMAVLFLIAVEVGFTLLRH